MTTINNLRKRFDKGALLEEVQSRLLLGGSSSASASCVPGYANAPPPTTKSGGDLLAEMLEESCGEVNFMAGELKAISESARGRHLTPQAVVEIFASTMQRTHAVRKRLRRLPASDVEAMFEMIKNSRNIMVVAGAGVSTSSGIPDFRSKGGIYDMVSQSGEALDDPQLLFDATQFFVDPSPFFRLASKLLVPENPDAPAFQPTPSHRFLKRIEEAGKLLRVYTQNVDDLERRAGIADEKIIQCHGSLAQSTCQT